ncbi:MAG TPA: nitroreductase family deazaflavin-dependent oxidoreductase [Pseudonocardia sp.]|jgi:deazaflavin-dependent oxidoreductase (nitroreductase family)
MTEMDDFNRRIIEDFRANNGEVGGQFAGASMLLLHTEGAKSGAPRISPMVYQRVDGGYAVFASFAGGPKNPAWYHNLVANPEVRIEVGSQTVPVRARVTEGAERDRIWTKQKRDIPTFAEYEAKTDRVIPVVVLEPAQ